MKSKSKFAINNQKEIVKKLSFLHKKKCLIAAHFGDHDETLITTLLDIDAQNNTLILDYGPKEYINKQILSSKLVVFKTEFSGIQIQFSGKKWPKSIYVKAKKCHLYAYSFKFFPFLDFFFPPKKTRERFFRRYTLIGGIFCPQRI